MAHERKLGRGGLLGNLKGQAGVYAVASQLCMCGHIPFFPAVDQGVDLVIENGVRIQVKSAHLTYPNTANYPSGAYGFNLRRGVWDRNINRQSRREIRTYAGVADFFVLWGIDENRFWIVPTSVTNRMIWFGRSEHVSKSPSAKYMTDLKNKRLADMESRWDLLDVENVVKALVGPGSDPTFDSISFSPKETI